MQLLFDFSLAFGLVVPAALVVGYRRELLTRLHLEVFALGTGLGFFWESGLNVANLFVVDSAIYTVHVSVSAPWLLHAASYSLWDGLLFLVGVLLVQTIQSSPAFARFRWRELGILILWGQLQSIVVELTAILAGLWTYHSAWWNPGFALGDGTVTVLPQLIWLVAMVPFYGLCLQFRRRQPGTASEQKPIETT